MKILIPIMHPIILSVDRKKSAVIDDFSPHPNSLDTFFLTGIKLRYEKDVSRHVCYCFTGFGGHGMKSSAGNGTGLAPKSEKASNIPKYLVLAPTISACTMNRIKVNTCWPSATSNPSEWVW